MRVADKQHVAVAGNRKHVAVAGDRKHLRLRAQVLYSNQACRYMICAACLVADKTHHDVSE